jgi:hypothetical protein
MNAQLFSIPFSCAFVREWEILARKAKGAEDADPELRRLKRLSNEAWALSNDSARGTANGLVDRELLCDALGAEAALLAHIHARGVARR